MRPSSIALTLCLGLTVPSTAAAQQVAAQQVAAQQPASQQHATKQSAERPKIGLVLAGGGALGCAHAGVIKVLEDLRIPVDFIVGTSMGSIVGASYAYGMSPEQLRRELTKDNWDHLLQDSPYRHDLSFRRKQDELGFLFDLTLGFDPVELEFSLPKGLLQGQFLDQVFNRLVIDSYRYGDFDQLPIPFRAIAADIATGEPVVLRSGSLPLAMRASMSVPGVFAPVPIDGRELVDGGIVNNLPVDVARAMGADVVIAVSIESPLKTIEELTSLFGVTGQMLSLLIKQNEDLSIASLSKADQHILVDLGDMSAMDFERAVPAMDVGERTARALAERLQRFSVTETQWQAWLNRQRRPAWEPPVLAGIAIENDSQLSDEGIRKELHLKPGDTLDLDQVEQAIDRIYGRLEFRRVSYRLEQRTNGCWLVLCAQRRDWGPGYLRFGLALSENFSGTSAYQFGLQYTQRELNSLGGEIRTEFGIGDTSFASGEFFQPLTADRGGPFVAPSIRASRFNVAGFDGGNALGQFKVRDLTLRFDVGYQIDNWGELRFGVAYQNGDVDTEVASSSVPGFDFENGGYFGSFLIDTFDDVAFPSSGTRVDLTWLKAVDALGADVEYQTVAATGAHAESYGRNTAVLLARYDTAVEGTRPVYDLATAGGFLNLSGFDPSQLTAQHTFTCGLIGYRQIGGSRELFGFPTFIGASLELGGFQDDRSELFDELILAGSAFVGVDTPLGPINVGYGIAEGGNDSVYLTVGGFVSNR